MLSAALRAPRRLWPVPRLRETLPEFAGVAGGLVVVGIVVAMVVTAPGFAALLPPSSASPLPSPSEATSPSPSASVTPQPSESAPFGLQPGQLAPPLELSDLKGGKISLAAYRGTAVWLNFLASWCPPCYDELPLMERYWGRFKGKGLVIVGVDIKESKEQAAALVKQVGVTFPVGVDPSSVTEDWWSSFAMPVHFWIDKDGYVRATAFGGISSKQMEDGIRSVAPQLLPTPAPSASPKASP
jgi:thiol-disulfide isomerase/thioredoxin